MSETTFEKISRGFSCPQESLNEEVLELIASQYARELTSRFIARYERRLNGQAKSLAAVLRDSIDNELGFEIAWDSSFGQIRRSLSADTSYNYLSKAAALAFRLHQYGARGEWQVRVNPPARLRMESWLLPAADYVHVNARSKSIVVETIFEGLPTQIPFRRFNGDWQCEGADRLPQLTIDRRKVILLGRNALDGIEFEEVPPSVCEQRANKILFALKRAIALLRSEAPLYLSWVNRVVRNIVPLRTLDSSMISGSELSQPGLIQMSFQGPAAALAEMLVHEGTHQYMYLLCHFGALDDGSDRTLYYSPIRQTGRPIRWILIAYHAFANVLLFYRSCMANGADKDQYCARSEKLLAPRLKQLETALRTSRALTSLGRALWEPLAAKIH